jgi:CRP-like cAMP-binding protein
MDEGVDPTQMCQSLMDRVAQSEKLMAVADPEVLVLFEDWLEEMEEEVVAFVKKAGSMNANDLADGLGVSRSGATFLITKLRRDGKL